MSDRILKILLQVQSDVTALSKVTAGAKELTAETGKQAERAREAQATTQRDIDILKSKLAGTRAITTQLEREKALAAEISRLKQAGVGADQARALALQKVGLEAAIAQKSLSGVSSTLLTGFGIGTGIMALQQAVSVITRITSALSNTVREGVLFNATFETAQIGVAAVMRSFDPERFTDFDSAMRGSAATIDLLKHRARETSATFEELLIGFQSNVGPVFAAGVSNAQQQVDLITAMSQAMAGLGIPTFQLPQEVRGVLEGDTSRVSRLNQVLKVTKTEMDAATASGNGYAFLMERLAPFVEAAKHAQQSFNVRLSNTSDILMQLKAEFAKPIFDELSTGLGLLNEELLSDRAKASARTLGDLVGRIASGFLDTAQAVRDAGVALKAFPSGTDLPGFQTHLDEVRAETAERTVKALQLQLEYSRNLEQTKKAIALLNEFILATEREINAGGWPRSLDAHVAIQKSVASARYLVAHENEFVGAAKDGVRALEAQNAEIAKFIDKLPEAIARMTELSRNVKFTRGISLQPVETQPASWRAEQDRILREAGSAATWAGYREPIKNLEGGAVALETLRAKWNKLSAEQQGAAKELETILRSLPAIQQKILESEAKVTEERKKGASEAESFQFQTRQAAIDAAHFRGEDVAAAQHKLSVDQKIASLSKEQAVRLAQGKITQAEINALAEREVTIAEQIKDAKEATAEAEKASADLMRDIQAQIGATEGDPFALTGEKRARLIPKLQEEIRLMEAAGASAAELKIKYDQLATLSFSGEFQANMIAWVNNFGTAAEQTAGLLTGTLGAAMNEVSSSLATAIWRTGQWKLDWVSLGETATRMLLQIGQQMLIQHILGEVRKAQQTATSVTQGAVIATAQAPAAAATTLATGGISATTATVLALAAIAAIIGAIAATGGFERGGPTRGRRGKVAGLVHGEEFVFDDAPTRNIGLENLEALRRGDAHIVPHFQYGGRVHDRDWRETWGDRYQSPGAGYFRSTGFPSYDPYGAAGGAPRFVYTPEGFRYTVDDRGGLVPYRSTSARIPGGMDIDPSSWTGEPSIADREMAIVERAFVDGLISAREMALVEQAYVDGIISAREQALIESISGGSGRGGSGGGDEVGTGGGGRGGAGAGGIASLLSQFPSLNNPAAMRAIAAGADPRSLMGSATFSSSAQNLQLMAFQAQGGEPNNPRGTSDEGHTRFNTGQGARFRGQMVDGILTHVPTSYGEAFRIGQRSGQPTPYPSNTAISNAWLEAQPEYQAWMSSRGGIGSPVAGGLGGYVRAGPGGRGGGAARDMIPGFRGRSRFAEGGRIPGAPSTTDSLLAWLGTNEVVIPSPAVEHWDRTIGRGWDDALINMRLPGIMPHFVEGGRVGSSSSSAASSSSGGKPANIYMAFFGDNKKAAIDWLLKSGEGEKQLVDFVNSHRHQIEI